MSNSEQEFHNCPSCFVYYSAPKSLFAARRADGEYFYCPNGHRLSYKDNENDKIRRERDRLKQEAARLEGSVTYHREQREAAERRAAAARGQVTKIKRRVNNGVCPCCNRTFGNLLRHMQTQHADFVAEEASDA